MSALFSFITGPTLQWLSNPATWVAVLFPAIVTAYALWKFRLNRWEILGLVLATLATCQLSHIKNIEGSLELHSAPVITYALIVLAGARWYLPPISKSFAFCWIVLVASDFGVMMANSALFPDVQLPIGIGGAGFGDALFVEPVLLAVGLISLQYFRLKSLAKKESIADKGLSAAVS